MLSNSACVKYLHKENVKRRGSIMSFCSMIHDLAYVIRNAKSERKKYEWRSKKWEISALKNRCYSKALNQISIQFFFPLPLIQRWLFQVFGVCFSIFMLEHLIRNTKKGKKWKRSNAANQNCHRKSFNFGWMEKLSWHCYFKLRIFFKEA